MAFEGSAGASGRDPEIWAIWGIRPSASAWIDVTVPSRSGRRRHGNLRIHRTPLPSEDLTLREGVPVTTPAPTLLDLAAIVPSYALKRAIEVAERLRLFDLTVVEQMLARNPGRAGSRALSALLED
jgi:hypothetical protein